MAKRKRRWLRILTVSLLILAILSVSVVLAAKFWIVPAVVRWQVNKAVAKQWDGEATIEEVEFNYFSPIYLRGLSIRDRSGREWLGVRSVKLSLRGFPGISPVLSGIQVEGVGLRAHFKDGKCAPPLLSPPESQDKSGVGRYVDLDTLKISDVTAAIVDESGRQFVTGKLDVNVMRRADVYSVNAVWGKQDQTRKFSVTGTIRADSGQTDLDVRILQPVEKNDAGKIAKIAAIDRIVDARGLIDGSIKITGDMYEPASLRPEGIILLTGFAARSEVGTLLESLIATVQISGGTRKKLIRITLPDLSATLCSGRIGGEISLTLDPAGGEKAFSYAASIRADGVNLAHLMYVATGKRNLRSGTASGALAGSGRGFDLNDLRAKGELVVRNIHLVGNPLLDAILAVFDIRSKQLALGATLKSSFRVENGIVLIDQANFGHTLLSLAVAPVGKVDIATHGLDLYVIGGPFDLLGKAPVIGRLSRKWFRMHVSGSWDSPKIGKEVLKDIPRGVLDLFTGTITDTRSLGGTLLNLLKKIGENNGTKK